MLLIIILITCRHDTDEANSNQAQSSQHYSNFRMHSMAYKYFHDNFKNNKFGIACSICDRLWFEKDLKNPSLAHGDIINRITVNISFS